MHINTAQLLDNCLFWGAIIALTALCAWCNVDAHNNRTVRYKACIEKYSAEACKWEP